MDLAGVCLHADVPVHITAQAVVLPGAFLPTILPLSCLPADVRARWLAQRSDAPIRVRITAALDGGDPNIAWELLIREPEPLLLGTAVERSVIAWTSRERARIGVQPKGDLQIRQGNGFVATRDDARLALRDVQTALSALPWPRWAGPLLLVPADDPLLQTVPPKGVRPALPVLVAPQNDGGSIRSQLAAEIAQLSLALTAPPAVGWPAWLLVGTGEVCAAIARGEGPSPRAMQTIRNEAGAAEITALFTAQAPKPALAGAVCAWFLHSARRARFANLLDPLRHGSDAATAIQIAYGISIAELATTR